MEKHISKTNLITNTGRQNRNNETRLRQGRFFFFFFSQLTQKKAEMNRMRITLAAHYF